MVKRRKENEIARVLAKSFIGNKFKIGNIVDFLKRTVPNEIDDVLEKEELSDISRTEAEEAAQNIFAEALEDEKKKVKSLF